MGSILSMWLWRWDFNFQFSQARRTFSIVQSISSLLYKHESNDEMDQTDRFSLSIQPMEEKWLRTVSLNWLSIQLQNRCSFLDCGKEKRRKNWGRVKTKGRKEKITTWIIACSLFLVYFHPIRRISYSIFSRVTRPWLYGYNWSFHQTVWTCVKSRSCTVPIIRRQCAEEIRHPSQSDSFLWSPFISQIDPGIQYVYVYVYMCIFLFVHRLLCVKLTYKKRQLGVATSSRSVSPRSSLSRHLLL